jgi:hypothetical protein
MISATNPIRTTTSDTKKLIQRLSVSTSPAPISNQEVQLGIPNLTSLILVCDQISPREIADLFDAKKHLYSLIKNNNDLDSLKPTFSKLGTEEKNNFCCNMISHLKNKYQRHVKENAFLKIKYLSYSYVLKSIFPLEAQYKNGSPLVTLCGILKILNDRAKKNPNGASFKTIHSSKPL